LTDELNRVTRVELIERGERAGDWRLGRVIPAHRVQRDPRQSSGFLCLYRLTTSVVSALGADTMRAFHRAAFRTLL
jgi:hypothetical protein